MASIEDIKILLDASLKPVKDQLADQARDLGNLTFAHKKATNEAQQNIEELTNALAILTQTSIETSRAIDVINARLIQVEADVDPAPAPTAHSKEATQATEAATPGTDPKWIPLTRPLAPLSSSPIFKLSHITGPVSEMPKETAEVAEAATDLSPHATGKNAKLLVKALKNMKGNESGYNPDKAVVKCVAHVCSDLAQNTQGVSGSELLLRNPHVVLQIVLAASPALKARLDQALRRKLDALAIFNSEASKAAVAEVDRALYSTPEQLLSVGQGNFTIPEFALSFQTTLELLQNPPDDPQNIFITLINARDRETFGYVLNRKHADFQSLVTELLSAYNASRANGARPKPTYHDAALNAVNFEQNNKRSASASSSSNPNKGSASSSTSLSTRAPASPRPSAGQHKAHKSSRNYKLARNVQRKGGERGRRRSDSDSNSERSSSPARIRWDCPVCESNDHHAAACDNIKEMLSEDPSCSCPISGHQHHEIVMCRVLTSLDVKFPKSKSARKGNARDKSSKGKEKGTRKQRSPSTGSTTSGSDSEDSD